MSDVHAQAIISTKNVFQSELSL